MKKNKKTIQFSQLIKQFTQSGFGVTVRSESELLKLARKPGSKARLALSHS